MTDKKRPSSLYLDLKELRERFEEVDKEKKGYIDYNGLQQMISNMEFDPALTRQLMDNLDRDKDGKVTLDDFQTLYTVERDVIKEHVHTAVNDADKFSPTKPPIHPAVYVQTISSSTPTTQVPDSPDLATHVRSLRGTVFEQSTSPLQDISQISSVDNDRDEILEDTGGEYIEKSCHQPFVSPPKSHSEFYDVIIRKELEKICPSGVVEKEHVLKLSCKLGLDGQDEQELVSTWEEHESDVSIDDICQSLHEKEKAALISSSEPILRTREAWHDQSSLSSETSRFVLKRAPKVSTPYSKVLTIESEDSIEEVDESSWINATDFSFVKDATQRPRPSSAKEGSRLSKGYSESSLRSTAMFQSLKNDYKLLQEKYYQITEENEALKANSARQEEEKKKLIQEGEESIQQLQYAKETELKKLKDDNILKIKEIEKSFAEELKTLHEKMETDTGNLKKKMETLRNENEQYKDDVKYYSEDNKKLVEDLQRMRYQLKEKDSRIAKLYETFGVKMESPSDIDLEMQAVHISQLEKNLEDYTEQNEDLKERNRELEDKKDELTAEIENLKLQIVEERRKRQRRKHSTSQSSIETKQEEGKKHSRKRLPNPCIVHKNANTTSNTNNEIVSECVDGASSDEAEDIKAVSSASLLDEMRFEDHKQLWTRSTLGHINSISYDCLEISDIEEQRSILEASCNDLTMKLKALEHSKTAMREELETELREKMFARANLDKRLKELRTIRDDISLARKKLHSTEDVLSQYMLGYESDVTRRIAENAAEELDNTLKTEELKKEIERLQSAEEERNKEIEALKNSNSSQEERIKQLVKEKEQQQLTIQKYTCDAKEMDGRLKNSNEMIEALKHENLEVQSQLVLAQCQSETLEEKCEEKLHQIQMLEMRIESKERELKRKQNEAGLAIHDLTNKEAECERIQGKVQKLEIEINELHTNEEKHLMHINQLENQINDLINEKQDLENDLNLKIDEIDEIKKELDDIADQSSLISQNMESPIKASQPGVNNLLLWSPLSNRSVSSTGGQSEIVSQMKTQLEDLQRILLKKGSNETSDTEMSVIQELLIMNTALEDNSMKQQQWYNSELSLRDNFMVNIQMSLREDMSKASDEMAESLIKMVSKVISSLSERISSISHDVKLIQVKESVDTSSNISSTNYGNLTKDEEINVLNKTLESLRDELKEKQVEIDQLETSLQDTAKEKLKNQEIIVRQNNELERLNHYLGKAKCLEIRHDREIEQSEKKLKEAEQDLVMKHNQILLLQEEMKGFVPMEDTDSVSVDIIAPLHQQHSPQDKTNSMQEKLSSIYNELYQLLIQQDIIDSSTSMNSLEFSDMLDLLKHAFISINSELNLERVKNSNLEKSFSEEWEKLYSEHEEEVRAITQERNYIQLKNTELEDVLVNLSNQVMSCNEEIEKYTENKTILEEALHNALSQVRQMEKQKLILVDTIKLISHLTLNSFPSFD